MVIMKVSHGLNMLPQERFEEEPSMRRTTARSTMLMFSALAFLGVSVLAPAVGAEPKAPEKYNTLCGACHGPTGKGDGAAAAALPVKPRNFGDGKYMNAKSDAHLIKVIKEGGPAVGLNPLMAPFGAQLSDKEVTEIVAYIRSLAVPKYQPKK
jgi:mono/diheme cytochrome c family protein